MAEQMNLLELIRQQTPVAVRSTERAGSVNAMVAGQVSDSFRQSEATLRASAEDQALIVQTAHIGQLEAQKEAQRAYRDTGAQDALHKIITTMVAEIPALDEATQQMRTESIEASGFSPIAWIKQAFDVNGTQARAAGAANRINALSGAAQEIEQRVDSVGKLARSTAETITTASIAASARVAKGDMDLRADQAYRESLKYNGQMVEAIAAADDKKLDIYIRARNLEAGEQRLDMERERMQYAREAALAAKEEKLTEQKESQQIAYYISLGRANRGLPAMDSLEVSTAIKLFRTGAAPELKELYDAGLETAASGRSRIAYSAARTAELVSKGQLQNLPEGRQLALKAVEAAMVELAAARGDPALSRNLRLEDDPKGVNAAKFINQRAAEIASGYGEFVGNNLDNPRHIGDLSSYIGTPEAPGVSSFQKYSLTKVALAPMIANGLRLSDVGQVMNQTMAAVRGGAIPMNQAAADFANIYARANQLRVAELGFDTLGIHAKNTGSYKVNIGGQPVDVTDYNQVLRAMVRQQAMDMFRGAGGEKVSESLNPEPGSVLRGLYNYGIRKAADQVPVGRAGAPITYTPENQAEGVRRIREIVAKQVRDGK
jgi:hypothetical protein